MVRQRAIRSHKSDVGLQKRFDSYCKKLLRNSAENVARRYTKMMAHEQSTPDFAMEQYLIDENSEENITAAEGKEFFVKGMKIVVQKDELVCILNNLQKRKREILLLNMLRGCSEKEVSEILGISYKTVVITKSKTMSEIREGSYAKA